MSNFTFSENRLHFTFPCVNAEKGDTPQLNGLGGVDFIVELDDKYLFVEVKDLENPNVPKEERIEWRERLFINKNNPLLTELGIKFKDTILRRWGMDLAFDKPIHYIVLLEFNVLDSKLKAKLTADLSGHLPTALTAHHGFHKNIRIKRREILSLTDWREKYKAYAVEVIA